MYALKADVKKIDIRVSKCECKTQKKRSDLWLCRATATLIYAGDDQGQKADDSLELSVKQQLLSEAVKEITPSMNLSSG